MTERIPFAFGPVRLDQAETLRRFRDEWRTASPWWRSRIEDDNHSTSLRDRHPFMYNQEKQ